MYLVTTDRFQFKFSKYSSITEAYWDRDDYNNKPLALFNTLEEAKAYLSDIEGEFYYYNYHHAEATVYSIISCDWYFEDEHYLNKETGKIERTYADLETFDTELLVANEKAFAEKKGLDV